MEVMIGVLLILAFQSFGAPVTSLNISVNCEDFYDISLSASPGEFAPSRLAAVNASVTVEEGHDMLDISWAINIDSTFDYIKATEITCILEKLKCTYDPPLAMARSLIPETQEQMWFHHRIAVISADYYHVQACNLPLIPAVSGEACRSTTVNRTKKQDPKDKVTTLPYITTPAPDNGGRSSLLVPVGGGLIISVLLLLFCYVTCQWTVRHSFSRTGTLSFSMPTFEATPPNMGTALTTRQYKMLGARLAVGFQKVAAGPKVPVLVVYPAESALFQGAVVALAEFLQQHGGCSVGIDMWQQGSVAKLGPMRWLLEQVQTAHRVIIVAPQASSHPSPQKLPFPGASIPPAAAQDMYPLALNLVASRAKNSTELAKFCVVQFEETRTLASELQACRTFSLMKDLNKLCRCLQSHRKDIKGMKIADLLMWRTNWCDRNCTEKLRAAVQALHGAKASVRDQDNDKLLKLMT